MEDEMEQRQRTVTVAGQGLVNVPPDLAHLRLGVQVTERDPGAALDAASERVAAVQQAIVQAGVAGDDVSLGRFAIDAVYDHVDRQRVLRGYRVSHDLSITVRDIDRTGAILTTAVHAGADGVDGVTFRVADPSAANDRARERAFEDALHRAGELVRLAGQGLGAVIAIDETAWEPVSVERREMRTMAASFADAEGPPDVPIQPGDTTFSVRLYVVWELTG